MRSGASSFRTSLDLAVHRADRDRGDAGSLLQAQERQRRRAGGRIDGKRRTRQIPRRGVPDRLDSVRLDHCQALGHLDLRDVGSSNVGATNVVRTAGWLPGALTFLLDFAKGVVPMIYFPQAGIWYGVLAVLGHCFSPFLSFKGGKGVSTTLGALVAFNPWIGGSAILVYALTLAIAGVSAIGSLFAMLAGLAGTMMYSSSNAAKIAVTLMVLVVLARHRDNWNKLLGGAGAILIASAALLRRPRLPPARQRSPISAARPSTRRLTRSASRPSCRRSPRSSSIWAPPSGSSPPRTTRAFPRESMSRRLGPTTRSRPKWFTPLIPISCSPAWMATTRRWSASSKSSGFTWSRSTRSRSPTSFARSSSRPRPSASRKIRKSPSSASCSAPPFGAAQSCAACLCSGRLGSAHHGQPRHLHRRARAACRRGQRVLRRHRQVSEAQCRRGHRAQSRRHRPVPAHRHGRRGRSLEGVLGSVHEAQSRPKRQGPRHAC